MGRYSKPIHVRVTEEEREQIEKRAAAAGLQFSEYVRAAATGELETSPEPDGPPGPGSPPSSAPGGGNFAGELGTWPRWV